MKAQSISSKYLVWSLLVMAVLEAFLIAYQICFLTPFVMVSVDEERLSRIQKGVNEGYVRRLLGKPDYVMVWNGGSTDCSKRWIYGDMLGLYEVMIRFDAQGQVVNIERD